MIRVILVFLASGASIGAFNSPPAELSIDPALQLTISGLPGSFHTLLSASKLEGNPGWQVLTNVTLDGTGSSRVQLSRSVEGSRFYKRFAPEGLVEIPPGTFVMGSPASEKERDLDETQHTVILTKGFWMGQHEVTQAEYESVKGSNPSYFKGALLPVETVSWFDATDYCVRLTEREASAGRLPQGYVYRLPTEAEWEYACRAGTTTAFHYGTSLLSGMANFYGKRGYDSAVGDLENLSGISLGQTTLVESYAPNPWGLYDMHGNVWEWCSDWYGTYPTGTVTDPKGPSSGGLRRLRVCRGGSWYYGGWGCRAAKRCYYGVPAGSYGDIGFRLVLAPGR